MYVHIRVCVCVCVCAYICMLACVRACACVCFTVFDHSTSDGALAVIIGMFGSEVSRASGIKTTPAQSSENANFNVGMPVYEGSGMCFSPC